MKQIIKFVIVLAFCMALFCVCVNAAQVDGFSTRVVPRDTEYAAPSIANIYGDSSASGNVQVIRVAVDSSWFKEKLNMSDEEFESLLTGTTTPANSFPGLYASGEFVYNGKTLYYKDVPIAAIGRNSGKTQALFYLKRPDIMANQYSDATYSTKLNANDAGYVDITKAEDVNSDSGTFDKDKSSFKFYGIYKSINAGDFPASTIFISVTDLVKANPACDWAAGSYSSNANYSLWWKGAAQGKDSIYDGPERVYVADSTATYTLYALRAEQDDTQDRATSVSINGAVSYFKSDGVSASGDVGNGTASGVHWFWDPVGAGNKTVTLFEGEAFSVRLPREGYTGNSRLTAIALVPVTETAFINETFKDDPSTLSVRKSTGTGGNLIPESDLQMLTYMNPIVGDTNEMTATVNETAVTAKMWLDDQRGCDLFGIPLLQPSVYDAVVAAGLDYKADGNHAAAIFVNGTQIYNADKVALPENATITVKTDAELDATNFSPIRISNIFQDRGGGLKYCFTLSKVQGVGMPFVSKNAETTFTQGLEDTYLVGYTYNPKDVLFKKEYYTEWNTHYETIEEFTIPAGTKNHFGNKKLISNAEDKNDDRISVIVEGGDFGNGLGSVYWNNITDTYDWRQSNDFQTVVTGLKENGDPKNEDVMSRDKMYLVNSSAKNELKVERNGNQFALTTDGGVFLYVIRKTEAGITVEAVTTTVIEPYVSYVAQGETVYLWSGAPITGNSKGVVGGGINMKPLAESITYNN